METDEGFVDHSAKVFAIIENGKTADGKEIKTNVPMVEYFIQPKSTYIRLAEINAPPTKIEAASIDYINYYGINPEKPDDWKMNITIKALDIIPVYLAPEHRAKYTKNFTSETKNLEIGVHPLKLVNKSG